MDLESETDDAALQIPSIGVEGTVEVVSDSQRFTQSYTGVLKTSHASVSSKTSSSAGPSPSRAANTSSSSGPGLFGVVDPVCGESGATDSPGPGTGPNGSQAWLNCGLSEDDKSSPWTPPHIDISDLKYMELSQAVQLDTFAPCKQWVDLFNEVGAQEKLPPIFLASIALSKLARPDLDNQAC